MLVPHVARPYFSTYMVLIKFIPYHSIGSGTSFNFLKIKMWAYQLVKGHHWEPGGMTWCTDQLQKRY